MTVDCRYVEDRMSAYVDGELPANESARVRDHLAGCTMCRGCCDDFGEISRLIVSSDAQDTVAVGNWEALEAQLEAHPIAGTTAVSIARNSGWSWHDALRSRNLAAASVFLLVVGIAGWYFLPASPVNGTDLTQFVARFISDPDGAQAQLVSQYRGVATDPQDAARMIGWQFASPSRRPPFKLASIQTLRMPCCDCVEAVCRRSDGTQIAVFGHRCHAELRVGDSEQSMHCDGKVCRLVELPESQYAIKWQAGDVQLVVVGARDRSEIEQLVAFLDPELP